MASALFLILVLISVAVIPKPNVGESTGELYWKLKLGSETPIPKIVKDALVTGSDENVKNVLKHMLKKGYTLSEELVSSIRKDAEIVEYTQAFTVTDQQKASISKLDQEINSISTAATIDPTKHSVYFLETDLTHPGKVLKLNFMKVEDEAKFFPKQIAKSIPFKASKLPEILSLNCVKSNTTSAEIMEDTLKACEMNAMSEEMKLCATSFEDMVDYVSSHVGKNNVSTFSGYAEENVQTVQKITGAKKVESKASMVCHKMGYPYAVFYCHSLKETNLYQISLADSKGKAMNAVGVCHKDTSSWSPQHVSFQMLKVKRGSAPVCHFLNERSIAFVRK